ncbi:MAG: hypothetical protein B7C24_01610 [Bacteroidetes bacterium 4572_77]|nr:MAG: hypothetical protein B7C24_01610 [Bacteroidetes bacterium 4572_77]
METISQLFKQRNTIISIGIDIMALVFIYFIPTLSHLIALPVYFIEPMRLMLILALVHTSEKNAYLIALTLPLFSFLISAHPVLPKMLLITFELSLNVFLFYLFSKKMKKIFPAILFSIIISKLVYYLLKFGLINFAIINSGLISTPIYIQIITTLVFSSYLYLILNKKKV